jgi:hypothetical protein
VDVATSSPRVARLFLPVAGAHFYLLALLVHRRIGPWNAAPMSSHGFLLAALIHVGDGRAQSFHLNGGTATRPSRLATTANKTGALKLVTSAGDRRRIEDALVACIRSRSVKDPHVACGRTGESS